MELDPRDRLDRLYGIAAYERRLVRFLRRTLRDGDTFIDGGAHVGYFSLIAASLVGDDGHVVSIEADPANFARLKRNLSLNPFDVKAIQAALAATDGTVSFTQIKVPGETGWGSALIDSHEGNQIKVAAISLDSILAERGATLIKLDVQGLEFDVLRHSQRVRAKRPTLVLETVDVWWGSRQQTTIADLRNLLAEMGYQEFHLSSRGRLRPGAGAFQSVFVARPPAV
jgi:FkbM family methyltransferase